MNITPQYIHALKPDEIFCFGSNHSGRHGLGAALIAKLRFGAVQGIGEGECGQTYAIPTKNKRLQILPLKEISGHVSKFLSWAAASPAKKYLVTKIGCGLARYTAKDIAPLFFQHGEPPPNVWLPQEFWDEKNKTTPTPIA